MTDCPRLGKLFGGCIAMAISLSACSRDPFVLRANCLNGRVWEAHGHLYFERGFSKARIKPGTPIESVCMGYRP